MKVSDTTQETQGYIFHFGFFMSKYLEQILNKDWLWVIWFSEKLSFSERKTTPTYNTTNMYKSTI